MDGQLNCRLASDSSAHAKIRHLENRVVETETRLDALEQETTQLDQALQDALTGLEEKVETAEVDTATLNADTVDAVDIDATNIDTATLTATAIEAESIDVANLENVNVLHGQTVDVHKTIADIGQFIETETGTANTTITNTDELNVNSEANLTGQVNIDGNMTFTKDTGLSKLQGNYLEIDAANVVIDNKNNAEYALLVPGINGDALFGGSVAVQDTLATKNLAVTGETYFKDGFTLDNPTLKNITDGGYSTTALDVDSEGKVVKVKLAANIPGAAEMLEANVTKYTSELNPILQRAEDDTNNFVFQVDTNTFLPMVYDRTTDETTVTIPNGDVAANPYLVCSHLDNIYYIKGSEYLKYNITTGATTVVAQIDESKTYVTMAIIGGKVLNEDIPAYYCANDNKMYSLLDGSELEVSFTINSDEEVLTVYADKNGKTYKGIISTDTSFNSILDEGQGVLFEVPGGIEDDTKGYAVNCPAAFIDMDTGRLGPINGGQQVDVEEGEAFLYRLAKDGTYIFSIMGYIYTYNEGDRYSVPHLSTIYNYGYFAGFDYITNTPYTEKLLEVSGENVFVAKDIPVEINGKYFVDGRWYDKVVTSYEEFMQFIVDTEQNYVSTNNYPKYFDVLYNNAGSEVISSNPWGTVANALNKVKHFYRLIGLRSNMNGDGYFGSDSMTDNGAIGEVRDIESIFTIEQNFDFFAPPSVLNGNLLYENIEFRYVNGFFKSSKVTDLKNCNIFIEGQWTNAQNKVTFEHCEDVFFMANAIDTSTGNVRYYDFNGCNGMFVDTLIGGIVLDNILINLSTMLLIKCNSGKVKQYGPGANAWYSTTGRREITLL